MVSFMVQPSPTDCHFVAADIDLCEYPLFSWQHLVNASASHGTQLIGQGGQAWDLTYTPASNTSDPANAKVVVIRTGFSTHAMNFGQRYLELATSFTKDETTGNVTLHVAQMPPNANLFQPGPAMIFFVMDGVPSEGEVSLWVVTGRLNHIHLRAPLRMARGGLIQRPLVSASSLVAASTPASLLPLVFAHANNPDIR
jgi:hypothetical protein